MSYMGKVRPTVALTSSDITDGAVIEAKIGGDAVTSAKINDGAIVNADINASAAIAQSKLATLAIDTAELSDDAVTPAKMADSAFLANRNRIINGNFDVWQRGTSFAGQTATAYFADRWEVTPATGCTMTVSRQAFTAGQTDVPYEPSYFLRADITTAGSANAEITNRIEDVRTFAGQTVAVSFYAKSTAGTQGLNCRLHQDFGSGGSTRVTTATSVKILSSSWQKFTFSVALGSISGKTIGTSSYLAFNFYWGNTSTSNDVDLAQVQVEAGSTYTPFEHKTYGQELAACQRYFQIPYNWWAHSDGGTATAWKFVHDFPVEMRAAPTLAAVGTPTVNKMNANAAGPNSITTPGTANKYGFQLSFTTMATGSGSAAATNTPYQGYSGFTADAEL